MYPGLPKNLCTLRELTHNIESGGVKNGAFFNCLRRCLTLASNHMKKGNDKLILPVRRLHKHRTG